MKVLFLSAWYPTARDAMAGLFVQKHAEAIEKQGADVRVIYSEARGWRWWREIIQQWKKLKQEWGMPDIVQVNVLDKNGLLALWLKLRYRVPYIIVEHWSGYLNENFAFRGGWHGALMRTIAKHAEGILPVSQKLEDAMKSCGIQNSHWQRIHNVVDDFFFHPITQLSIPPKPTNKYRLLHVSCFDEKAKNIQGLLRAARAVANQRQDFELVVVGTGIDYQVDRSYADKLDFPPEMLHFTGEQTPYEVAQWMQESDAFVLFSRYETYAVVLAEAVATGLPIISTSTAGIASELPDGCGVTIENENEEQLAVAIQHILNRKKEYNKEYIKKHSQCFHAQEVGKSLLAIYDRCLHSHI